MTQHTSRREFLKTSTVLASGVALAGGLSISQSAHAQGSDQIKVALVGCGSRGSGAIRDRAQVGDNFKVVAVADVFEHMAQNAAAKIREDSQVDDDPLYGKVELPAGRVFGGFDAYQKAIACLDPGDMVLIANQPGFHPFQYRAAVERGCHVFVEKPICIDAPGFRHVMETNRMAEEKNLKICVGFQRRYEPRYVNWINQIHAGEIGDVHYTRVFWNGNTPWTRHRNEGESELAFQLRNWYHFVWLCGENIAEQHAHNIDVGNWILSKGDRMAHPVEANAMGGRTFKAGPEDLMQQAPPFSNRPAWDAWYRENRQRFNRHGQAWDQFFVEFTYEDGTRMYSQCRHKPNVWNQNTEFAYGTNGSAAVGRLLDRAGTEIWANRERAQKGPYQWEHDVLVKAVRENLPLHDGYHSAMACMAAVLGREAAFSGRLVKWDELVEKGRSYMPDGGLTSFDQPAPVQPDANGFYESTVPVPGVYNPFA